MSVSKQLKQIQRMYSENVAAKGANSIAVGWTTEEGQRLRFSKLSQIIYSMEESFSVNDYGCGYGAFFRFLEEDLRCSVSEYNGYDISEAMLSAAKKEFAECGSQAKTHWIKHDTLQTVADYSFVCGTFNVKLDAKRECWEEFIKEKLSEMHHHSRKGFAFNLLTSCVDWEEPHLYYGDPCYWFDFCKRNFSKRVALLHDYPLWEWTILVGREP